jgi:hypothetical protein
MEFLRKIGSYLLLKKQHPGENYVPFNLKAMHIINKISIFMFLIALVLLAIRFMAR